MARSIGDWFADHTDGRDGNFDDEFVEGQAIWDTAPTDSRLGKLDASASQQAKRSPFPTNAFKRPQRLSYQRKRAEVLAIRSRFPTYSYKQLANTLSAEGISITRAEVAAILNGSGSRHGGAKTVQGAAAASKRNLSPSQRETRLPSSSRSGPQSLSLDEPVRRRRVRKAGWHRAKIRAADIYQPPINEPAEACKACGVIPAASGACRCT